MVNLKVIIVYTFIICPMILSGCGGGNADESSTQTANSTTGTGSNQTTTTGTGLTQTSQVSLTPLQKSRSESLTAIWENGQTQKAYGYAENINDGRGITWGWCGFTTADGDAIAVVEEFEQLQPNNPLTPYLSQVHAMAVTDEAGFIKAVAASNTGIFQANLEKAQNNQSDKKYYLPALKQANTLGLKTAAAIAEIYDSEIVHGDDGVSTLIAQTNTAVGGTPKSGIDEIKWLNSYLDIRYAVLAADPTWKTSTDRVTVFKSHIVAVGNINLDNPIHINSSQYGIFDIP